MVDAPQIFTTSQFANRLRALLPDGWFPSPPASGETEQAPVLNAMLQGCGAVFQFAWSLLQYVYPQQRLATATGAMLDIYAQDFFGSELPRETGETDDAYRARIEAALVPLRFTRPAIEAAIADSWDDSWALVEPRNANDTKGMATAASPAIGGGFGYGTNLEAGYTAEIGDPTLRYGSLLVPFQGFILLKDAPTNAPPDTVCAEIEKTRAGGVVFWISGGMNGLPVGDFGQDIL
ncbi:hypothetical protein [Gluconobacter potus]|uniref:hypothetical protein n=1 Tax=Gluconobacter potus TaxID=2724927 RepID=UPI000A87E018|nr:hypothetical protein [Gluconobacter potus]